MSWSSWTGSVIPNGFVVLVILAILGGTLFRITGPDRRRRVMGIFALLVFAGSIASMALLQAWLPTETGIAMLYSGFLVALVAGTIAWAHDARSFRPAQWAAFGAGTLILASAIAYLSFPDLRSLVDPVVPAWTRTSWLALGLALTTLAPSLIGEILRPREAGERGLWHPSQWTFERVSSVVPLILVALVFYSMIFAPITDPTWFIVTMIVAVAITIVAVAIMIVAPLIWPVVSRRLWDPRQWTVYGVGVAVVAGSLVVIGVSVQGDIGLLVGVPGDVGLLVGVPLFFAGVIATLYGSNLRHRRQWLAAGVGVAAVAGGLLLAGSTAARAFEQLGVILFLAGVLTVLFLPRLLGSVLEARRKASEELRALREGVAIEPSSPKLHLVTAYMEETGADLIEAVADLEKRLGPIRDDPKLATFLRVAEKQRDQGKRGRHAKLSSRSWHPRHWSVYGVGLLLMAASLIVIGVWGHGDAGKFVGALLFLVGVVTFLAGVITTLFRNRRHSAQWLAAGAGLAAVAGGLYLAGSNPSETYRSLGSMVFLAGVLTILIVPRRIGSHLARGKAREEVRALREGVAIQPSSTKLDLVRAYMDETGANLPEAVAALEERLGPMRDDPQLAPVLDTLRRRREWATGPTLTGSEPTPAQS